MRKNLVPAGSGGRVGLGRKASRAKLAEQIVGGAVGEAEITAGEILIEDRGVEEAGELLPFGGGPREGQNVAAAKKYRSADLALERRKKDEFALIEGNFGVAAAKFDVVVGLDLIAVAGSRCKALRAS